MWWAMDASWFQALWIVAWTIVVAMGGALWRTMASREYVQQQLDVAIKVLEQDTERMMVECARQDMVSDELRVDALRGYIRELQTDIRELRRAIDEIGGRRHP
jgi:hypothetical protein